MLILRSPDSSRITVFNKRHDLTDREAYSATENITGYPVSINEDINGEAVTGLLFTLAGKGWQTQFMPDRGHPKAPHLPTKAPPSDYPQSTKG